MALVIGSLGQEVRLICGLSAARAKDDRAGCTRRPLLPVPLECCDPAWDRKRGGAECSGDEVGCRVQRLDLEADRRLVSGSS